MPKSPPCLWPRHAEATRNILNSLPNTLVYVVSKDLRLLYGNDALYERFPHARTGMFCHKILRNEDKPCAYCMFLNDTDFKHAVHIVTPDLALGFHGQTRITGARILWEDKQEAFLAMVSDHVPSKEEQKLQEQKNAYVQALCDTYDYVLDVDTKTETYDLLALRENDELIFPHGNYADLLDACAKHRLHPEDVPLFLHTFALQSLTQAFQAKASSIELKYRWKKKTDDPRWKSRLALPYHSHSDGHQHILTYVRDITAQVKADLKRHEETLNYLQALQSNYSEIFYLDIKSGQISPLYYDSKEVPIEAGSMNIAEFVAKRARDRVHPDSSQAYLAFYDLAHVADVIQSNVTDSTEYRKRHTENGEYRWTGATIRPVPANASAALLLVHDITDQKRQEEERLLAAQRFSLALRGAYTEVYEMDTDTNTSCLLFSNTTQLVPVGTQTLRDTKSITEKALHPADRARVFETFCGAALRKRFTAGEPEISIEFRRLGYDGKYYWVSATLVPLWDGDDFSGKTMMLVKDISTRKEAEQQQRLSEQYFLALRNIYDVLFEFNVTRNTYRTVHRAAHPYLQAADSGCLSDLISTAESNFLHPEDRERLLRFFDFKTIRAALQNHKTPYTTEARTLCADGTYQWVSTTVLGVPRGDELELQDEIYLVFFMDIQTRKQTEELLHQNTLLERQRVADERYRIIIEQTNTLVFEWNTVTQTRYISPEMEQRFAGNYDNRDLMLIWRNDRVIHPDDMAIFENFLRTIKETPYADMTVRFLRRSGGYIWCKVALTRLSDSTGATTRFIGTINDVDEATTSIKALQYRAEYDTLTGVFNASSFYSHSEKLLHDSPDETWYVIRMDINRFKVINDLYGLKEGDALLKTIATILENHVRHHGICGRIGGDVFCACLNYNKNELLNLIHSIEEELKNYPLPSRITLSFGICAAALPTTPINVLCDWANLALKTIKGNVLTTYAFYDGTLRERILDEKKIETEMHAALTRGDFQIFLQPKVDMPSGRIVGAEGLARWQHPQDGLIMPGRFIPLFERNGFIIKLDEYIWEQSCRILRSWLDRGLEPVPLSVNVSRLHIHDLRLPEKLINLVDAYRLPPNLLELELTESLFFDNETKLLTAIQNLQEHGFNLSLDDFGAGYSSLNMLKSMPVEIIKIDRGFLSEISGSDRGKTVVRHTIALARDMNLEIVAEGVETEEQARFLMDAHCTKAQGFFYSPPVPVPVFERMAFAQDQNSQINFPPLHSFAPRSNP